MRALAAGLLACGAPVLVHTPDAVSSPTAAVGPASVRSHEAVVDAAAARVCGAVSALLTVLPVAPPGKVAESLVYKVLVRCVWPRLSYVCRVCPPDVVLARAQPAFEAVVSAIGVVCGWTEEELARSRAQLFWPVRLGGFGFVSLDILAPASYLASWLALPVALGWDANAPHYWAEDQSSRGDTLRSLYRRICDLAPVSLPSSLAGLDLSALPPALRLGRVPGWQAFFVCWLAEQAHTRAIMASYAASRPQHLQGALRGEWWGVLVVARSIWVHVQPPRLARCDAFARGA